MAKQRSHLSTSVLLSGIYLGIGFLLFRLDPEVLLLGSIITVLCGILPNIDSGPDSESGQQFIALLTAVAPLILLSAIPELRTGGIARIALVLILSFFLTRSFSKWALAKFFSKRGTLHSIPAAVIIFEITYLLFFDLFPKERLYLGGAAFCGFMSHLLLDAVMNVDLVGNKTPQPPVLKLGGKNWMQTTALYTTMVILGWFVLKDVYPSLRLYGGVKY